MAPDGDSITEILQLCKYKNLDGVRNFIALFLILLYYYAVLSCPDRKKLDTSHIIKHTFWEKGNYFHKSVDVNISIN